RFYVPAGGSIAKPVAAKRRKGLAPALDVARYLVYLATCEPEPDFLSHLRLQKLLYYVQGWSLALRNRPMFDERIEAWAHGPLVRDVSCVLSGYGDRPIVLNDIGLPEKLVEEEMGFIESVWESYKQFSAISLRAMSHKEQPWLDARMGQSPADRCENEITQSAMRAFFTQLSA